MSQNHYLFIQSFASKTTGHFRPEGEASQSCTLLDYIKKLADVYEEKLSTFEFQQYPPSLHYRDGKISIDLRSENWCLDVRDSACAGALTYNDSEGFKSLLSKLLLQELMNRNLISQCDAENITISPAILYGDGWGSSWCNPSEWNKKSGEKEKNKAPGALLLQGVKLSITI